MRGDFLGVEGWGVGCGEMGVEGEPARDGVAGEREPAAGGKDGVGRFAAAFAKPRVESVGGGFCQWRDAVLAALCCAQDYVALTRSSRCEAACVLGDVVAGGA
jgi:hypothetical protein